MAMLAESDSSLLLLFGRAWDDVDADCRSLLYTHE